MLRSLVTLAAAALVASAGIASPAQGATTIPTPALQNCSYIYANGEPTTKTYACLMVDGASAPAATVVRFSGTLSASAAANLTDWTGGTDILCLTRYRAKPEANGSWPWETLDQACTTLNRNRTFTLNVALGKRGMFFYGVEMGPCRASASTCGDGDPGLVGLGGKKAVAHRTT